MTGGFEWVAEESDGVPMICISGRLNEEVDFAQILLELAKYPLVRLNLADIAGINSCGVREWIYFVDAWPATTQIEVVECSPPVVKQLNMISNFLGRAKISSVQAPYICDSCGHQTTVQIDVAVGQQPVLPAAECPECGEPLLFDSVENFYFRFLKAAG